MVRAVTIFATTDTGETITIRSVVRVTYEKVCPYLDHSFETDDQDRIYCCDSHRVMFFKKMHAN